MRNSETNYAKKEKLKMRNSKSSFTKKREIENEKLKN
jgi:hypothetical protein